MTLKLLTLYSFVFFFCSCHEQIRSPLSHQEKPNKEVLHTQMGEVQKGQGLFQALRNVSIKNDALALSLINALRDEVEFSKLKVGDKLEATFDEKMKLVGFSFSQNQAEKHSLKLNAVTGAWDYSFLEEPTMWTTRLLEGQLRANSTLQEDLLSRGLPRPVVAEVVNILLCKVNFRMHARMGDRYRVLLNERMFKEKAIQTQVLYTSYRGKVAGVSEVYFYQDKEKGSTYTAHYTEDGQALINSGIRYPLSRLHIRSGYGFRRHPVTGLRAMHRGVDFRGKIGMPVYAVAAGTVVESSYNEFAGNKVRIRHRDGSISVYMHLQKKKVQRGQWVKSHQVIGTLGATGRVTGPHLHFGFKKSNGKWMDPMKKRMIATPKLSGKKLEKLKEQVSQIKALLQDLELSKEARYLIAQIPKSLELKEEFLLRTGNFQEAGRVNYVKLQRAQRVISRTY